MFNKDKLKAYMDEHEMTCRSLGEILGVSEAMVSYIARGIKQPSVPLLARICEVTGMSADELIVHDGAQG